MTDRRPAELPEKLLLLPLSSFVGRQREAADVHRLLGTTRLLTITGAGGAGKTRLALHVASGLADAYADGVYLVGLEAVRDGSLIPRQIATELGVREEPDHTLGDTLIAYLHRRQLLLIIDNCEHLARECAAVVERLLRACAGVRVLATSRQPLGIAGETTWRIPSLTVPDTQLPVSVERLRRVASVQLFSERAAAAVPGFEVSERNAAAVADVCLHLDGMPLAVELAAARVRALSVEQIAARLGDRFRLLTGGSPTALPRQQTLRGTLDWSHDLLDQAERTVLRRLSVFAGSWSLEAAEAVCGSSDRSSIDVVQILTQLVEKSLVLAEHVADAGMRYRMLETIREYAREKLDQAGEVVSTRRKHASWMLSLANTLGPVTTGRHQSDALQRLLLELDNLRAALDWATEDASTAEAGLRACVSAYRLWLVYGYLGEGRRRLVQFARLAAGQALVPWRAYALFEASTLAMFEGDYAAGRLLVEESLSIGRETSNNFQVGESLSVLALMMLNQGELSQAWGIVQEGLALCRERIAHPASPVGTSGDDFARATYGDTWQVGGLGRMLLVVGVLARVRGNSGRAVEFYEESLECLRQQGDAWFVGQVLSNLGLVSVDLGQRGRARQLFEEALALRRALGDRTGIARSLNDLGGVAYAEADFESAREAYSEQLRIERDLGDRSGIADALVALGQLSRARGDLLAARRFFAESLAIRKELGHRLGMPTVLNDLAELAAVEGDGARAIRLAAAAAALRELVGSTSAAPGSRGPETAYQLLGDAEATAAWDAGRSMSEDQVLADALAEPARVIPGPVTRRGSHLPLSQRELAVARLIAFGRTNRQIATELVIAEGTAERHVSNILSKLNLTSRAQVGLWLVERGLLPL